MLTIGDVLQMPAVRSADPGVLAGAGHLDRQVRWVHTTELADIGPLLRGGDLVMTTGIALPDHDEGLTRFADSLADSGAAGLFVELGRRWSALPAALVAQCEERGLPLVALRREVRFAAVAQAVGERLVDEQLDELRAAERVHETFTELSITEAGPAEILAAAQRLSGAAVVLETEQHQIVDYLVGPTGQSADGAFLDDWERRSRNVRTSGRTAWDASNGWLVTRVGRPERGWGRLVIGAPGPPSPGLTAVAERAAAALAMHRLHDRTRDGHVRRVHHELLIGLLSDPANAETHRRAEIAGLPPGRQYVGLALRPQRATLVDDLVAACLRAAEVVRAPTLASVFESEVRALVALPARGDAVRLVDRWAEQVTDAGARRRGRGLPGRTAWRRPTARCSRPRTCSRRCLPATGGGTVRRLDDLHLRGLLTLLADDARVTTFADRELGRLREEPELLRTLRSLVEHPGQQVRRRRGPEHLAARPLRPHRPPRTPARPLPRRRRDADVAARRAAGGRRTTPRLNAGSYAGSIATSRSVGPPGRIGVAALAARQQPCPRPRMRAAIMTEVGADLVVDEVQLEAPRAGEVSVEIRHCGVCHSDVHYLDGSLRTELPVILGHEAAGVVAEVGAGVTGLAPGDTVVLTMAPSCGRCYWCVRDERTLCQKYAGLVGGAFPDGSTRLSWQRPARASRPGALGLRRADRRSGRGGRADPRRPADRRRGDRRLRGADRHRCGPQHREGPRRGVGAW